MSIENVIQPDIKSKFGVVSKKSIRRIHFPCNEDDINALVAVRVQEPDIEQ